MNVEELVYGILGCPLKEIQCKSNKLKFSLSFKIRMYTSRKLTYHLYYNHLL